MSKDFLNGAQVARVLGQNQSYMIRLRKRGWPAVTPPWTHGPPRSTRCSTPWQWTGAAGRRANNSRGVRGAGRSVPPAASNPPLILLAGIPAFEPLEPRPRLVVTVGAGGARGPGLAGREAQEIGGGGHCGL